MHAMIQIDITLLLHFLQYIFVFEVCLGLYTLLVLTKGSEVSKQNAMCPTGLVDRSDSSQDFVCVAIEIRVTHVYMCLFMVQRAIVSPST